MYLLGQEAIETGAAASTIVERVDPDALGAMMVLSVIGGVFALVAIVWMVSRMITNIFAHRENTRLVTDLLNRGYSRPTRTSRLPPIVNRTQSVPPSKTLASR